MAKEIKKIKGEIILSPSPLSEKQLLFVLQRTPKEHIYRRPGKGGGEFEYVTSTYMKKVLNFAFGWMWDFEIKEHGQEKDLIWALGRLTIKDKTGKPMIVKEQFGRSELKYYKDRTKGTVDFGNDLKAAASDALKKCAAELGIASDVYGRQEFKEIQRVDKGFIPPVGENGNKKEQILMATETDKKRIVEITKEMGANTPQATAKMVENVVKGKVDWGKMTKNEAATIYATLLQKKINKK